MILNNKYFKSIIVSIIFLYGCYSFSQTSDLLRVEYLNIPNSSSKNSVERFRGFFQLPLKIKENNFLIISGDYRTTNLEFNNVPFLTKDLENIQRVEASIGYCLFKQEGWTYAINAGLRLASNFAGRLVKDDYIYLANIYAIRDRTKDVAEGSKPNRLILGLNYTTTPGRDFPLPIINYYREFHPDWTYTLGVPKTNIRYKATKTNHIQAFLTLDNFHANIQKNVIVDNKLAEHMSMTTILAGIGYEHYFTDHLLYYGYLAYTVSNDHRLRDNERNDIYTFEDQPSVYFRTGIKFKI